MRVAVAVFWPYGLKIEGIRANIDALVDSARHAGHEVEVVLSDIGARDFAGAPVYRYGGVGLSGAIVSVRGFRRVLTEIGGGFDLILCLMRFPSLAFVLDPLPETIRQRLVAIFDGVLTGFELLPRAPNLQALKLIVGQHPWWLPLSRFRAGAYACTTQYQRRQMIAGGFPAGRVAVIPNALSPRLLPVPDRAEARTRFGWTDSVVAGYMGHCSPVKGVLDLVESAPAWLAGDPRRRLALALSGRGSGHRTVESAVRRLGFEGRVELHGVVDAPRFLGALDIAVFPYAHESLMHHPSVLLECARLGTPVVTTDVGGLGELVVPGRTGLLAPPRQPRALAQAIDRLLSDAELRAQCSAALREAFSRSYDSDIVFGRLSALVAAGR
jgi:glycosyltransferase involved in cell wall biosynthesis